MRVAKGSIRADRRVNLALYVVSVLGSGCGFVTQMLVSGFWSTAYSHDVFHFSINLAFYFLSLGLGSLFSNRWKQPSLEILFVLVFLLCLWTGLSISLLRLGILWLGQISVLPILIVSISGLLAGTIIPLTMRVGKATGMSLSLLLCFDYTAAIFFTLIFTHFLLIPLGYGRTALVLGGACLALALPLFLMGKRPRLKPTLIFAVALLLPLPVHVLAARGSRTLKSRGDGTRVLVSRQSHYQKIVLTEEKGMGSFFPGQKQHVLYLDGFVQFSSLDEQSYHACIANIPQAAAEYMKNPSASALILGGGDGLAARNLLAIPKLRKVTLVELDPAMIELAQTDVRLRRYNLDSLKSPRLDIVIDDAFHWVRESKEKFDIVVIDFPHPKNVTLSRLFSAEFYSYVFRLLNPGGFVSIQAGPAASLDDPALLTYAPVPIIIRDTVRAIGMNASVYVSPRDEEAFVLATSSPDFRMQDFAKAVGILGMKGMGMICTYYPDWKEPSGVGINTLNTLSLSRHMLEWYRRAGGAFFNYQGRQGIFLPD